ncbi:hypothetical protein D9758_000711 [Tetrapyrgos nigripes]|uniref:Uncharacterized protein n=1 Tax=Tetrapyrgos nigripes TaxID=182062 RepID=A0A8H5LY81_9AGAR|nr:hypothetical protein D9758_000711 [Tetrapyrgos nigripes]
MSPLSPSPSSSTSTTTPSRTAEMANSKSLALPDLHFTYRWSYISLYVAFLIFCNVFIPCLLFYLLESLTPITTKELIGISSAALGLSSCFDAPFRLIRLVRHRSEFGPLGSDVWWHLDFVMWTYTFALLVFAFPLAIAPAIAFYNFFLMSTMMLVGPIGVVFLFSLITSYFKYPIPIRCSSEPRGTIMKPAAFYCLEDVAAVDFKHGRAFRKRVHESILVHASFVIFDVPGYAQSPPFRQLMMEETVYWIFMAAVYCGITAAVTWATPLNFAFGWVLGQFFMWIFVSAFGCYFLARRGLARERAWWAARGTDLKLDKEGPGGIEEQRRQEQHARAHRDSRDGDSTVVEHGPTVPRNEKEKEKSNASHESSANNNDLNEKEKQERIENRD